jgi:hypothetical protein
MSHFSDIGFTIQDESTFLNKIVATTKESVPFDSGKYIVYRDPSGAELWLQISEGDEFLGINPHYYGQSSRLVRIDRGEKREAMDGAFTCWVKPREKGEQDYPMTFDVPDFYTLPTWELPIEANIQITAFAHSIRISNEKAWEEKAKTEERYAMLAREAFIPSGQFTPDGKETNPPTANAILSGRVLAAEKKLNEFSGETYLWMYLKTLSAEIDVVCDLKLTKEIPEIGSIVSGSFWISGKLIT